MRDVLDMEDEVVALSSPAPLGRRARKLQLSRDRLYESALSLFLESGFDATTVDQIAERADVARATVFNHFPQKMAFLEEWGARRRALVRELLQAHSQDLGTAAEELAAYLTEFALLNERTRDQTRALMEPALRLGDALRSPTLDVDLALAVKRGQSSGEFRADVDADHVGQLLTAGYFTTVLRWASQDPEPFPLKERLLESLDLILRGLR